MFWLRYTVYFHAWLKKTFQKHAFSILVGRQSKTYYKRSALAYLLASLCRIQNAHSKKTPCTVKWLAKGNDLKPHIQSKGISHSNANKRERRIASKLATNTLNWNSRSGWCGRAIRLVLSPYLISLLDMLKNNRPNNPMQRILQSLAFIEHILNSWLFVMWRNSHKKI